MRAQLIETSQVEGKRNSHMAAMYHNTVDASEFVGRMSRAVAPLNDKKPKDENRLDRHSAFLSKPSWITTGVFKIIALTESPTLIGKADGCYDAFLSAPTWIRTGVFGLTTPLGGASVPPVLKVFDRTWITTGVFELTRPWGRCKEPPEELLRLAA